MPNDIFGLKVLIDRDRVNNAKKYFFCVATILLSVNISAQSPATGTINGHDYVDLGLSVMWATCNIGANSPEEYGDYFAWGEAETKARYIEPMITDTLQAIETFSACDTPMPDLSDLPQNINPKMSLGTHTAI